jgi:hypothetical protein
MVPRLISSGTQEGMGSHGLNFPLWIHRKKENGLI